MADDDGKVSFHFLWQTQVFATVDCPARWLYPLNMTKLALKQQREILHDAESGSMGMADSHVYQQIKKP